jgi:hypothetical protein
VKLRLTCKGTRPLLLHNERLASPLNSYSRRLAELTVVRNKTEEQLWQIARLQFEGGLYFDEQLGPYVPANQLRKSLITGARHFRAGKQVERGVAISDFMLPIAYDGPRDIEGLWGGGTSPFVDLRSVRVAGSGGRIDRCRPIFREWVIEAEVILDPEAIDPAKFAEAARWAGEMEGIGDYREMYGRFGAEIEHL